MDGLTHSLVGLTSAKAGLDRLSPYTAVVCILSANAPDADVVSFFFGGRWVLLREHRGITHSIVGTLALGFLIPTILYGLERLYCKWRGRSPRIRYPGLLLASIVAAVTHPVMDWTNNYGVRPLLPWSGRWFYGDLVFIIDPYLLLVLGGAAFLLTSDRRWKIGVWTLLAVLITVVLVGVSPPRSAGTGGLAFARVLWIAAALGVAILRATGRHKGLGRGLAFVALTFVIVYWGSLAWAHHAAYQNAEAEANAIASQRGEHFVRTAVMPTAANPFQWLCIAETDRAMYRFFVGVQHQTPPADLAKSIGDASQNLPDATIERYEKPSGVKGRLVAEASRDPRAQILLGFARFPMARVENDNCIGQTLVQFADLRYTEPGASRGSFSLSVPIDCPAP
jgi:inner membrane protein